MLSKLTPCIVSRLLTVEVLSPSDFMDFLGTGTVSTFNLLSGHCGRKFGHGFLVLKSPLGNSMHLKLEVSKF